MNVVCVDVWVVSENYYVQNVLFFIYFNWFVFGIVLVIDDCVLKLCNNGGICIDLKDDVICDCFFGYLGKFCEIENDECLFDFCYQGVMCVDKVKI